jgi:hypothetical protein
MAGDVHSWSSWRTVRGGVLVVDVGLGGGLGSRESSVAGEVEKGRASAVTVDIGRELV